MKARIGTFFILIGMVLMVSALVLFLRNDEEQMQAVEFAEEVMPQIVETINTRVEENAQVQEPLSVAVSEEPVKEMSVVEIDGYTYVGFVGIPSLELELQVMTDWSYEKLRISPCHYTGNVHNDDLVIMAHNYARHFGKLSSLQIGDSVTFTDMDGETVYYQVVALDVLMPTDIEDMTAGEYDLTLFTCTYGGQSRVTVRCDRVE